MSPRPILILAVDDEKDLCVLTKEFLESSGNVEVDIVGSVAEAREAIAIRVYDAIVSDYQMPEEDGIQFLKSLRATGDMTPFILFTGKGREEVAIEAINNGADAYLQKGGEPRSLFAELEHRIGMIVRRHRAETSLLDSESEFRTLFDDNPDSIVVIGNEGRILNCNQAAARMVLMSKEQIIGHTIFDMRFFSSDDLALFQRSMIAMKKGDPTGPIETKVSRMDGTIRWVEIRASMVTKAGRFHAIQIIARDVTQRKNVEEELKSEEARNRVLFELAQMSGVTPKDIAQKAMDSSIELTHSQIGYIAFLKEDESAMIMQHYSMQAMEMNVIKDKSMTFKVGSTSLLAEAIRQRRPVITNDYDAPNPLKKGLPLGHIKIKNHMSIPVIDRGRVVAVAGVGNKDSDYSEQDATNISLLMDGMWRIVRKIEAEEALRESERRFRTIAENTADIIWTMDFNLNFTYVSPSVAQMRGYTVEEAMNQSIDHILTPSSMETALNLLEDESVRKNMQSGDQKVTRKVELDEYCKDGRIIKTENTLSLLRDELSTPIGIVGVTRDVTGRKHVEEALKEANRQLSMAMELAQLVYWEYNERADEYIFNDRFYALYGTNATREGGYSISREAYYLNFIHPDDVSFVKEIAAKAPDYLRNDLHFTHRIIRRDGEVRFIEVYPCQLKDDNGNTTKVFGVNQDITETKRVEEGFRKANEKLNLLSSITRHDITNQLMIQRGCLGLIREKISNPDILSRLQMLEDSIKVVHKQIEFTKDYESLGTTSPQWQSIGRILKEQTDLKYVEHFETGDIAQDLIIYADPMLNKVIHNLFENSIRYCGRPVSVTIDCQREGYDMLLTYEDSGPGIIAEEKSKIFQKGFGKGTGLGLFLCREILSITGIAIVENGQPGKGARFEIRIPFGLYRFERMNDT
jgi:PAS domain S-box-containing protein